MENIIIKTGVAGSGKTDWLIRKVYEYENKADPIYYFAKNYKDTANYVKFISKYYIATSTICPVLFANDISNIPANSVVIIDNLFKQNIHMLDLVILLNTAKKVYVTIEGITEHACHCLTSCETETCTDDTSEQMSIFDMMEEIN